MLVALSYLDSIDMLDSVTNMICFFLNIAILCSFNSPRVNTKICLTRVHWQLLSKVSLILLV